MKIGIIGGGSIGLLVAYYLSKQKNQITVYVNREEQKQKINESGLYLHACKEEERVTSLLINEVKKEDIMFICVKQYQLSDIWNTVKHIKCPLIFMQNGMGHVEDLDKLKGLKDVIIASVEHGARRLKDNKVKHNGEGQIKVAFFSGDEKILHKIEKKLNSNQFPFIIMDNWFEMLAHKMIINAVINPITAIFQVKNGEIIDNPYLLEICKQLSDEAATVLGLDKEMQWKKVLAVAKNTKNNDSSMKLDISSKRRTEIDAISGYIINCSNDDLPYTRFVYNSIKAIELSYFN